MPPKLCWNWSSTPSSKNNQDQRYNSDAFRYRQLSKFPSPIFSCLFYSPKKARGEWILPNEGKQGKGSLHSGKGHCDTAKGTGSAGCGQEEVPREPCMACGEPVQSALRAIRGHYQQEQLTKGNETLSGSVSLTVQRMVDLESVGLN